MKELEKLQRKKHSITKGIVMQMGNQLEYDRVRKEARQRGVTTSDILKERLRTATADVDKEIRRLKRSK